MPPRVPQSVIQEGDLDRRVALYLNKEPKWYTSFLRLCYHTFIVNRDLGHATMYIDSVFIDSLAVHALRSIPQ